MSIEQNLADLTAAVNNLTAVLQSKLMAGSIGQAAVTEIAANATAAAETVTAKKDQKAAAAASSAPPADTPATKATTAADSGTIDFTSQIQKPIVALAAGGKRAEALAILKELGAAKASEIKPADYARAVELIAKVA
jgi:hypothetical protein